jgi:hypothetical protein
MEKLYRLVKAAGICFSAYGVAVGVRVNEPGTLEMLRVRLPPGARHQEPRPVSKLYSFHLNRGQGHRGLRRFHTVYSNDRILLRSENEDDLYEEFERDLDSYIAETSTVRFFVHAGVVGWKGYAIVVPGRSYSGKTTLVAEFLRAGAAYYSDEFAVFDRNGYVHSFSRPLGVRVEGHDRQTRKAANEFGRGIADKPLRVGLVILTEYQKSASWRPRVTSPGRGVLELLVNSLSARTNPAGALRFLTRASEKVCFLRGVRGEASEVVRKVRERFETRFPAALGGQHRELGQLSQEWSAQSVQAEAHRRYDARIQ